MHNVLLLINLAAVSAEQQKYAKIGHFCPIIGPFCSILENRVKENLTLELVYHIIEFLIKNH